MPSVEIDSDGSLGAPLQTQSMARELMPLLYGDLRRVAHRMRWRAGAGGTLQTTALIHEAYLKLQNLASFNDREHFLRASALAMRHVLVDHARRRMAQRRGGCQDDVPLDDAPEIAAPSDETIVEINEALKRLARLSPRLAQVVECRFFAGYNDAEIARALEMTDRTVRRDWVKARAWLRRELGQGTVLTDNDVA